MAESKLKRAQRDGFKRYKDDVKREGKPFFPYAMFHDTIMALVVVVVIIALACVWYFTAKHAKDRVGLLGPLTSAKADPGTTSFVPRPDWFFYFLFYLLRIFKWPDSVFLGTVGVPTILLVLLIGLPFYDRRTERRLLRRPVAVVAAVLVVISMGVLTWKGAIAKESLGAENLAYVPAWAASQASRTTPAPWPVRSSLPSPAASTATRISAPARRTSARPIFRRSARAGGVSRALPTTSRTRGNSATT